MRFRRLPDSCTTSSGITARSSSVQSGCIRPRDVCLGSLNSIGLSLLRSGRSLPRSCMFLAQVGNVFYLLPAGLRPRHMVRAPLSLVAPLEIFPKHLCNLRFHQPPEAPI